MTLREIEKEDILKAIEYINKNGVPYVRESKKFDLECNGKHYPPKYVISIANKFANGEELDPQKFNGGRETNDFLRGLGFKIVNKKTEEPVTYEGTHKDKNEEKPRPKPTSRNEEIKKLNTLWDKTERALFKCISQVMGNKYGKFWMERLENEHLQLWTEFDECRHRAGARKNQFPSNDVIRKAYVKTLFNIIRHEWYNSFSSIFKGHTKYKGFEPQNFLVPLRDKLQHPERWDELSDKEIDFAEEYLDELLDILKSYQDTD